MQKHDRPEGSDGTFLDNNNDSGITRNHSVRFAAVYALFGITWIIFSDKLVEFLVQDAASMALVQSFKGVLFIVATTALVYYLVRRTKVDVQAAQVDKELQATRSILSTTLESMGDAAFVIDPENRTILQMNKAAQTIFGYEPNELIGQNTRLIHVNDESFEKFGAHSEPALEVEGVFRTHQKLRRKDGQVIDTEVTVSTLDDKVGWGDGVLSIVRDVTEREKVMKQLSESEDRYRNLVQSVPAAVYEYDSERVIGLYNQATVELWGCEPKPDDISREAYKIHILLDSEEVPHRCPMNHTLITGESVRNQEVLFERPDGTTAFVLANTLPVRVADDGTVLSAVSLMLDVTDQRIAEETKRKAEKESLDRYAFLRQLMDSVPDAIFVKDRDLRYRMANRACLETMGRSEEEVIYRTDEEIFPNGTASDILRDDARILDTLKPETYRETVLNHRGETRLLLTTKLPLFDSEGQLNGVCGIARDITEFEELQSALAERLKELRLLYNVTTIASKSDTTIEDMLGEIVNRMPEGWLYPDATEARIEFEDKTFATPNFQETRWHQSTPITRSDKNVGTVSVALSKEKPDRDIGPFLFEEKELLEAVAAVVSEALQRENLRNQYLQAQKLESVGRLAGGVAHDFNNVLSVILGYTELLMTSLDPSDKTYNELREISLAAKHAAGLTKQLLAFSRQEVIHPVSLDLNETIGSTFKMLNRLLTEDISLNWNPHPDPCTVQMDPNQVQQILANLVVNARDAIEGTGEIIIETSIVSLDEGSFGDDQDCSEGQYILLAVTDTGAGMDEETKSHVFEPFYTTKKEGEGTGLGLATVYGIIKQNEGLLNVYSEPGEGTCFRIYLPCRVDESKPKPALKPSAEHLSGTETLLIVEDDSMLLELTSRMVQSLGYTILTASDPESAIQMVRETDRDIDLVLTDVVMPHMNGKELFIVLKELRPELKCLYMSGYTADVIAKRGKIDEDVNFLAKPFSRVSLAEKIHEVLHRAD